MPQTVNANEPGCFKCHADKRGPFVFEHAPVKTDTPAATTYHGCVPVFANKKGDTAGNATVQFQCTKYAATAIPAAAMPIKSRRVER
jgi:hypothetical protein